MLRFGETKVAKETFYGAKTPINIWDVNVDNVVIWKLVETKTNSKYLIGYLDKVIKPLVLVLSKMSGHVKTFKVKDRDKDKNNKLISFRIDDEKLLENVKPFGLRLKTCSQKQISASVFRQLCLWNCRQANDRLSWWQCFSQIGLNVVLR